MGIKNDKAVKPSKPSKVAVTPKKVKEAPVLPAVACKKAVIPDWAKVLHGRLKRLEEAKGWYCPELCKDFD